MDTQSILIGTLIALTFMLPILYVILSNLKKEKKRILLVQKLCKEKNIVINSPEVIGNTIIGVDDGFHNLVVADRLDMERTIQIIPLSELTTCSIKVVRVKNKTLDRVELDLAGTDFNKEIIFYREDDESNTANGEACLHEAYRWETKLRQRLQLS